MTTTYRYALATVLLMQAAAAPAHAQPAEPAAKSNDTAAARVAPVPPSAAELKQRFDDLLGRPGGLTASEAGKRARATSPLVRAKSARIAAAEYDATQAKLGYFPRVSLTARYARLSPVDAGSLGSGDGSLVVTPAPAGPIAPGTPLFAAPASLFTFPVILDSYTLAASLAVPLSDIPLRVVHAQRAAGHAEKAASVDRKAIERSQVTNAKLSYFDWVRRSLQEVVAAESVAQAEEALRVTRALEEAGRASPADVLQGEAQLAGAKLMRERARHGVEAAMKRLRAMMHDDAKTPYAIGEDPTSEFTPPAVASLDELYAEALTQRPELEGLERQGDALDEQRRVVSAGNWPRLDAFANFTLANPNQRVFPQVDEFRGTWDLGVQLTYSPNDTASSLTSTGVLAAKREELAAQAAALADAIKDEVREAELALREATLALDTTATGLAAAEEGYRVRLERFRLGSATALEMSETNVTLLRSRLDRIDAQLGQRMAALRLVHALGRGVD